MAVDVEYKYVPAQDCIAKNPAREAGEGGSEAGKLNDGRQPGSAPRLFFSIA